MRKYLWLIGIIIITTPIITSFMTNNKSQEPKLFYLIREPKIKSAHPPLLILMHGVGGNETNLFHYANQLPDKYLIVSLRGPLTLATNSYAWFQVDFSSGKPVIVAEQAEQSRKMIIQFIENFKAIKEFDTNQVYLLGFSQGAIMSYSVALTSPEKVTGIAVMSGRLLPEVKPLIASDKAINALKIFISHGTNDHVLNYQYATDAVAYLKTRGLNPEFHSYEEDHQINPQMLHDVINWLQ